MKKFWHLRNSRHRGLLIGVVCAAICLALSLTTTFRNMENWSLDLSFIVREIIRDEAARSNDIVIVAMDDDWYLEFKKPKMYISPELAKVVGHIRKGGARAVGIDFYISDAVHGHEGLQPGAEGDATEFGNVRAEKSGCTIVLPEYFISSEQGSKFVFPVRQWQGKEMLANDLLPDETYAFLALYGLNQIDPDIDDPWNDMGFVNLFANEDNAIRSQLLSDDLSDESRNHLEPSFAMAVYASANGNILDEGFLKPLATSDGELVVPHVDRKMRINYAAPTGEFFINVPFMEVLRAADEENATETVDWNGKIVLIGETYSSSPDRHPTPFNNQSLTRILLDHRSPLMPGVEIHAHTIQTMLDKKFITTPLYFSSPILLLAWAAVLGPVLMTVNLETGLLITFVHHFFWKAVCITAFILFGWHIQMIPILTLGAMLFAFTFAMRWRWIRRMMGMVKSEAVARALEEDPSKLDLKGEERELTILFSDIRSFTTFSENHTAHEVVTLLNEYFAIVVPVIEKHGGVVNQYMGDGVMVLFGAPREQKDHARNAIQAAIEMVSNVHANVDRWTRLDAPDLRIGVGIHTGKCVVGTVGSPNRLDYTAIGDTTNTAARIESGNKELGTEILASAATVSQLQKFSNGFDDLIGKGRALSVKGKKSALTVHEIRLPIGG